MEFNNNKCHIMHVSRCKKPTQTVETLNGQPLSVLNQATYLGVEISSNLSWTPQVNKVTSKTKQSWVFLRETYIQTVKNSSR